MKRPITDVSHAPLSTRKALFTRSAVLDAFADIDERGCTAAEQTETEAIRELLLQQCVVHACRETSDGLPLDAERLDTVANRVVTEAQYRAELAAADKNHPLAAMLLDLATRAARVDCDRCADLGACGPPCGEEPNHELVSRRGECIIDLKEVYAFGFELGARLYADALPAHTHPSRVEVVLRTRMLGRDAAVKGTVRLGARTDFEFDDPLHGSIVTLSIDGPAYGPAERAAAAYLIVHEIVAHAFYDTFSPDIRSHRDPHDQWAEGWMDCVAADLLIGTLKGGYGGTIAVPSRLRGSQACIDMTNRIHAERYEAQGASRSQPLNGMKLARKRYMAMKYRLRALDPFANFDPMRTIQLACAIVNANGAADETVAAINSAAAAFVFGAADGSVLSAEERRFHQAMSSFLAHRDETTLIGDLA